MLTGDFDDQGRPWITGYVVLPRLKVQGSVDFLIDTGSDSTVIHPSDGKTINVPFDELSNLVEHRGIGGSRRYYREDAIIFFLDDSSLHRYPTVVSIAKPDNVLDLTPSLIGRPLLNAWRMLHDPFNDKLEITHQGQ